MSECVSAAPAEGAPSPLPPASSSMSPVTISQLHCQAVVYRIGEIFGEFGVEMMSPEEASVKTNNDPVNRAVSEAIIAANAVTRWQLFVVAMPRVGGGGSEEAGDDDVDTAAAAAGALVQPGARDEEVIFHETLDMSKPRKVVKLEASRTYRLMTRCYSKRVADWGPWSDAVYATTLNTVTTSIASVGEDFVRVLWDRQPRAPVLSSDRRRHAVERNAAAMKQEADIAGFELQLVQERTMTTDFSQAFETGVRSYTVRNLTPATAYILLVRYETTLQTLTAWREVGRFYTEAAVQVTLTSRGEDVYSVSWRRGDLGIAASGGGQRGTDGTSRVRERETLIGYHLPTTRVHLYELYQESPGLPAFTPIRVPASTTGSSDIDVTYTHRMTDLLPGTHYRFSLRAMGVDGTWGCRSNVLDVRTAEVPEVAAVAVGETFLSFTWSRPQQQEEGTESKVEYCVQSLSSQYKQQRVLPIHLTANTAATAPEESGRLFHVESLAAGSDFAVSIRLYLDGEWGNWTEGKSFSTLSPGILTVVDRGEESFVLGWPVSPLEATNASVKSERTKLNVVVMLKATDTAPSSTTILNEETVCDRALPGFRVGDLVPNTAYVVKCRSWESNPLSGYEDWGEFTKPMEVWTLRPVPLQIQDFGEDFASVTWRRDLAPECDSDGDDGEDVGGTLAAAPVKYEIMVHCLHNEATVPANGASSAGFAALQLSSTTTSLTGNGVKDGTEAALHDDGDGGSGAGTLLLDRQVVETSYMITNLRPATSYTVAVRACGADNQWGAWRSVTIRTLSPIAVSLHEIGEDFVRLMWQRLPSGDSDDDNDDGDKKDAVTLADSFVSKYSVFVYGKEQLESEVCPDVLSGYPAGGKSDLARREIVSSEHTSLRVGGLLPDREYVAVVRAATSSGTWGQWSRPVLFRTTAQFCIPVDKLSIGENYVSVVWTRDASSSASPSAAASLSQSKEVKLGDSTVTGQQLRVRGVNSQFAKDQSLAADVRELKVYGLQPASAYYIQLRVQGKSGSWGLWSPPVHFLTRGTILTKAVEVAEDYAVLAWERRKVSNPNHYPTGRGVVTSYHLRVHNHMGVHTETFLADSDCPYRITGLLPDTYYCVELKANYNDEEWGLWSSPLWCLTMQPMTVQAKVISEQFCRLAITRPSQQRRLPEDDGNRPLEDEVVVFGEVRPSIMLCVTTPILSKMPHTSSGYAKPKYHNSSLPPNAADHRLIYQTELLSATKVTEQTISNLKSNTVYSVSVRAKLPDGEWGMWSQPTWFATVPTTRVTFTDIGESFIKVDWKRYPQVIPPQVREPEKVCLGLGTITASRVRVREVGGGTYQHTYLQESSATSVQLDGLRPATTYAVSVQTYNDNYDWGVWSEEGRVRTVPGVNINVQHVSEDALWVSWARRTHLDCAPCDTDTAVNVNVAARGYHVRITGPGGFHYNKEMTVNKLFFRGLMPDTLYRLQVRTQFTGTGEWGLWSTKVFRTRPRLRVTFGSIGEHFAILEWRRHLPRPLDSASMAFAATADEGQDTSVNGPREALHVLDDCEDVIQQFRFKVQRVGDDTPLVFELMPTASSFHLKDLLPSSEYRVWGCAKGYEGVWGFWSEEARVRTLPKLQLSIENIGEDYVKVHWRRGAWEGVSVGSGTTDEEGHRESDSGDDEDDAAADAVVVRQVDGAASGYQLRVLDRQGHVVTTHTSSWRETSCMLSGLDAASLYSVEVCAKDTYDEWGLWSDAKLFVTLHGVTASALQVGETFIDVEWSRTGSGASSPMSTTSASSSGGGDAHEVEMEDGERYGSDDDVDTGDDSKAGGGGGARNSTLSDSAHLDVVPADAMQEDGTPTQWHVRVHCRRIYAGVPLANELKEFYCEPQETWRRVDGIVPNATYVVTVRAKNCSGEWGHWSAPLSVNTYPLLHVEVESVGETFVNLQWGRPPHDEDSDDLICFPRLDDAHNYQVHIRPMDSEKPFDEADEPLVNGARVYETTQPTLRLGSLLSGTRYTVVVREQMIDEDGKAIPGLWGAVSEPCRLETAPPLHVVPVEIGEDYCLVEWRRMVRSVVVAASTGSATEEARGDNSSEHHGGEDDDGDGDGSPLFRSRVTAAALRAKEFELHTLRLADDGVTVYAGPLSLDTVELLPATSQTFHIDNLIHNSIYAVRVRAKGPGGTWGPWSATTKFVTQGRLELSVESVYERSMYVCWTRPLPAWARALYHSPRSRSSRTTGRGEKQQDCVTRGAGAASKAHRSGGGAAGDENSEVSDGDECPDEDDDDVDGAEEEDGDSVLPTSPAAVAGSGDDDADSALRSVILGDYSIQLYEVSIRGISCSFAREITLARNTMSTCIEELEQNQIYSVCVRSLSENQHWSMWSSKRSVLTLSPMQTVVKHHTENSVVLQWSRALANVRGFAGLLEKARAEAEKACDERERRDLFELKRRVQEMENRGEKVSGWLDQATRKEHNALLRQYAIHHLLPENVVCGDAESTAFHLRVSAANAAAPKCFPYMVDLDRLRLRGSERAALSSARTTVGSASAKRRAHDLAQSHSQATNGSSAAAAATTTTTATTTRSAAGVAKQMSPTTTEAHSDGTLIDVLLQDSVGEVMVSGLHPDSTFSFAVRARNAREEWLPWSTPTSVTTLSPITLAQSRFGEHYINLFWHRMDPARSRQLEEMERRYRALQDAYGGFTKQDLEEKKRTLTPAAYAEVTRDLCDLRDCRTALTEAKQAMADGNVDILVAPTTPIHGFLLRIVQETGEFTEHYISRGEGDEADTAARLSAAFTATGLQPNNMYVCLLCANYGGDMWGMWTQPVKFMTQNLIQLEVTYMSESFVDIEWYRMSNKKLPLTDRGDTIVSDSFYQEEQFYQLRIEHEDPSSPGETVEEFRDMKACNVFRVDRLLPDTKYTIAVREWDAKGDWGLWCAPRTCVTLPGTFTRIEDAGEDFVTVSWGREQKRVDYDNDMHVLQAGVETTGYYLRVMELSDGDEDEDEDDEGGGDATTAAAVAGERTTPNLSTGVVDGEQQEWDGEPSHADGSEPLERDSGVQATEDGGELMLPTDLQLPSADPTSPTDPLQGAVGLAKAPAAASAVGSPLGTSVGDEVEGLFVSPVRLQQGGPLPPYPHPELVSGEQANGRILIVKRFDPEVTRTSLRACLKADRLYCVQVMAESSGEQLGVWSPPRYCQTLPKIVLTASCIDEQFVDICWERPAYAEDDHARVAAAAAADNSRRTTRSASESMLPSDVVSGLGSARFSPPPLLLDCPHHGSDDTTTGVAATRGTTATATSDSGDVDIFLAKYETSFYELEVTGPGFTLCEELEPNCTSFHVQGLQLNTPYTARVRSVNVRSQISLWSDELRVVTLQPVTVRPLQITETAVEIEWGRAEQREEHYTGGAVAADGDGGGAGVPWHFGSRDAAGYQVRVMRVSSSPKESGGDEVKTTTVLDKTFPGDVQRVEVPSLALNTAYVVTARARNVGNSSEWSQWSEERCVYTMKLIKNSVAAVGEDFIRLVWERDAPDEVTVKDANGDAIPSMAHPLLDKPLTRTPVYASAYTRIQGYDISVRSIPNGSTASVTGGAGGSGSGTGAHTSAARDVEEYTLRVPADTTSCTIPSLVADTVYVLSVRACYGSKVYGPWSDAVQTGTYNLLALELRDLGEDFFAVNWQRRSNTADLHALQLGKVEETACYELALLDCTDDVHAGQPYRGESCSSPGNEVLSVGADVLAPGVEGDRRPTTIFIPSKQRHCTLRDLQANHRYRVHVRRWYEPLESFLHDCPTAPAPQTSDEQILEAIARTHAVPGTWSEAAYIVTLRSMVCSAENIGEDFFSVRWERDPHAASLSSRRNYTLSKPVQSYEIRIDQLTADGTAVDGGSGTYHVDETLQVSGSGGGGGGSSSTNKAVAGGAITSSSSMGTSTFTAQQLRPSGLYRVEVRCCIDRVWGRWSTPIYIMTLPKLQIGVRDIGEDSAVVVWERNFCSVTMPDGTQALVGDEESSDRYHLEISGVGCSFEVSKTLKGSKSSYTVKHLETDTVYAVRVRSADSTRQSWSLWSDVLHFVTLAPLTVVVGPPGEQFARVQWHREPQPLERYKERIATMSAQRSTAVAAAAADTTANAKAKNGEGGATSSKPNAEAGKMPPVQQQQQHGPSTVATSAPSGLIVLGDPDVIAYHLCVFNTQFTPSQAVVDKQFHCDVTAFRMGNLTPDTPYVVIVRACNSSSSQWGRWSEECPFRTLKLLQLHVGQVGENYLDLKWERETGEEGVRYGSAQAPTRYLLALKCEGHGIVEHSFSAKDVVTSDDESSFRQGVFGEGEPLAAAAAATTADVEEGKKAKQPKFGDAGEGVRLPCFRVHGLLPATEYVVALQPRYGGGDSADETSGDWGLWSKPAVFCTLSSVQVTAVTSSSNSVELTWDRAPNPSYHATAVGFATLPRGGNAEDSTSVMGAGGTTTLSRPSLIGGSSAGEVFGAAAAGALAPLPAPAIPRGPRRTVRKYQLVACRAVDVPLIFPPTRENGSDEADTDALGNSIGMARIPDRAETTRSGGAGRTSDAATRAERSAMQSPAPDTTTTTPAAATDDPFSVAGANDPKMAIPDTDERAPATYPTEAGEEGSSARPRGPFKVEEEFVLSDIAEGGGGAAGGKDSVLNFRSSLAKEKRHFTLEGLAVDTAYVVQIRAQDTFGVWGPWSQIEVYTPPPAPSGVTLRKVNAQYCSLQWNAPPGAGQEEEAYVEHGAKGQERMDKGNATASPPRYRRYRYVVEQMYLNPPESSSAATPATGATSSSVRLGKSAGGAAAAAAAAAAANSLYDWHVMDIVEDTVCAIRILGPTSRLRCRVKCLRVVDAEDRRRLSNNEELGSTVDGAPSALPYSAYSEVVSLTSGTPPEPVRQLLVTSLSRSSATLEWTAPPKPTDGGRYTRPLYRVYLSTAGQPPTLVATAHRPTYTLSDLMPSCVYTVQIVAENADGMSYRNPAIRFSTKPEEDTSVAQHDATSGTALGVLVDPANSSYDGKADGGPAANSGTSGARAGQITIPTARDLSSSRGRKRGVSTVWSPHTTGTLAATVPTRPTGAARATSRTRNSSGTNTLYSTKKPTADGALVSVAMMAAETSRQRRSSSTTAKKRATASPETRKASGGATPREKIGGGSSKRKHKAARQAENEEDVFSDRLPRLSRTF